MSRWESPSGSWEDPDEFSRRRDHSEPSESDVHTSHSSSDGLSQPSISAPSFALVRSEETLPEVISFQKPWLQKRHLTNGNPSPIQARHNRFHQWRLQDKLKTGNGAIVVCLNLDVDPPDVVKTQPCAVLEGWIDPRKLGSAKALEAIGKNLCQQFQSLNTRIRYKPFLDPSIDETRRFCVNLRKTAKDERLCFYYNGHGVPKPTSSGELWVFNRTYSQYIPVSLYDLQTWLGSPVVYVWDCSAAGNLVKNFIKYAKKRDEEAMARHGGNIDGSPPHSQAIQLAACLANETLPMAPSMPADMFTSCLTSPIEMALQFYFLHQNPPPGVTLEMLHEVPGDLKDRRTPLGELNWIFTAVTDTIAWTFFPRPIFKRLFRQDLLVAALFRNFLLAERVMRNYHCTPHTIPPLPSTATHPLWAAWDRSLEDIIKQLPELIKAAKPPKQEPLQLMEGIPFVPTPYRYEYKSSSFFTDHLTAFEHWMSRGGGALTKPGPWSMPPTEDPEDTAPPLEDDAPQPDLVPRKSPAQLPILLQLLLSQAHRMRALKLLCQFVDLGPWAVHLVLEIGIYPYVQKLLLSPQGDLKPLLIFIWSRLIAFDKTCQVDLLREQQFTYFATILDYSTPVGIAQTFEHRAMCAFILASLCRDHPPGQAACLAWNKGALLDFYLYHISNSDDFLVKQWCCLAVAQLWDAKDDAKELGIEQGVPKQLLVLLKVDASCEVRAAALYALAIFYGASGSASPEVKGGGGTGRMSSLSEKAHLKVELESAVEAVRATRTDASPIVRKEAVILISALANEWRGYFTVAAWLYWEEERQGSRKSSSQLTLDDIANRALDEWTSNIRTPDPEMKRQHRKFLNKFFLLLIYLYDLVADPHTEVSTMATTVLDFIVAMLLESPFSRIQGTTVRGPPAPPTSSNPRTRKVSAPLGPTNGPISRQGSMTSVTSPTFQPAPQSSQLAGGLSQQPTRSSFPGLMRTSSFASALGSLAGLAMGTQSASNTAPPSPSQSQHSDIEPPPTPALNLAQYVSPYSRPASPESFTTPMSPSSARSHSIQSATNGRRPQSGTQLSSKYSPAVVVTALVTRDLMRLSERRRSQDNNSPDESRCLWEDFAIDAKTLDDLEDLGLDVGSNLNQTLPLKSKLYDWCLEYYKEPQMRQLDEDEPGSLPYTRQVWRRNRDSEILETAAIRGHTAPQRSWSHPHGSWRLPFSPARMAFHQFDSHAAFSDEGSHVIVSDWRTGAQLCSFNNGNPKDTSVTSLHFVDEEVGGAIVAGSSDGVVRIYNNYDPCYNEGNPVQLVSGFRALSTMSPATRGAGIVTEWNQMWNRLLCAGDSVSIYDWDAITERCVTVIETEENCPLTSMASNPYSRRTFVAGFGNGAIKVYDTRASSSSGACLQNRREHRSWVANVKYQTGASKQVLSASVDGTVNLWDLRNLEGVVSSWEVFADGLASFDVHPAADVFIASSSLSRSWRNQTVLLHPLPRHDKLPGSHRPLPMRSNVDNTAHEQLTPITAETFPTGLASPSRTPGQTPNIHFAPSVLAFHPTEMMYALGTADGIVRLAGCRFSSGKQGADEEVPDSGALLHTSNGKAEQLPSKSPVSFPTMR